jgi:hypothetical protein
LGDTAGRARTHGAHTLLFVTESPLSFVCNSIEDSKPLSNQKSNRFPIYLPNKFKQRNVIYIYFLNICKERRSRITSRPTGWRARSTLSTLSQRAKDARHVQEEHIHGLREHDHCTVRGDYIEEFNVIHARTGPVPPRTCIASVNSSSPVDRTTLLTRSATLNSPPVL